MSILKKIVYWNNQRGLIEKGFDHAKEISFIVEELLESTGKFDSISAREKAEKITQQILTEENKNKESIVDALADIIVYSTGAIAKLGYDPDEVMAEAFKEIDSRKGKIIDGKFVKDSNAKVYRADFSSCKSTDK